MNSRLAEQTAAGAQTAAPRPRAKPTLQVRWGAALAEAASLVFQSAHLAARRWARYFLISALDTSLCLDQTMPNLIPC